MKDHAWTTLGHVVKFAGAKSKGKRMFIDTKHIDSSMLLNGIWKGEGLPPAHTDALEKSQDFHAQVRVILYSYLELQENGMMWDLYYRGKEYKDLELVFFSIMVKCDTEEADVLCGKYKNRTKGMKQLCRYCTVPNIETDDPMADFPEKTVAMIKALVDMENMLALQALSQQCVRNAWYKVRFSPVNEQGIHGACPSEMLHAVLLGIFKYTRECFFTQIGPSSNLCKGIDALADLYGELFNRKSERDLPKCKFGAGIAKGGKIMAKEYRGVLLVMAAVLRSTKGRELLKRNNNFKKEFMIQDWLLLVEMLLEWEAYLCEPRMKVTHLERLAVKNRYIMWLFKKVARRTKGMGLKLMKYHAISHMANDVLLYGVPMEHDTGANESHHKATKVAACLTQKKPPLLSCKQPPT
jgi:hypothetical protein